jgi:hypothetical protein
MKKLLCTAAVAWALSLVAVAQPRQVPHGMAPARPPVPAGTPQFALGAECLACHNGLMTSGGEDVSIGSSWRASMMANAARDPYWQAAVRRETIDHPNAAADIEAECSICHMPMARTQAMAMGRRGQVFAHLPVATQTAPESLLAADGVSCTLCHQITADKAGTRESFTGRFVVNTAGAARPMFGPFWVPPGVSRLMQSATGFVPTQATHVRESEQCASCHTLYTHAIGPKGEALGEFPEQVPYLEWRHSAFRQERSCQSCHMPAVTEAIRLSSVMGPLRTGLARHAFRGGNFFMLRMLNRFRTELGVQATPQELDVAARLAVEHLQNESAALSIDRAEMSGGRLLMDVSVRNLAGHKLPTAYPSRRAWLHVAVRDASGRVVFESGAFTAEGRIRGNDNDDKGGAFEPHYEQISSPDEVQIYESVMVDSTGAVTTGLLKGTKYVKDNRLLPRGFDKRTAEKDIAVHGPAAGDADFLAGGDRVRYAVPIGSSGPLTIDVELCYQPIGFRWADNLRGYKAPEPERFVRYYDSMSGGSVERLARATTIVRPAF